MLSVMIHQPEYLPWSNLFIKMVFSDVFVFLDTVQYVRRSFQNRNKIKTRQGEKWLTVPLKYAFRQQLISKIEIDNSCDWKRQHLFLLKDSYRTSHYYKEVLSLLEPVYLQEWDSLSELNCALIMKISQALGLKTKFLQSSELGVEGKRSGLILNICLKLGSKRYISGVGAKAYLDEEGFKKNNIDVVYIAPFKMEYKQVYPELGFIPDLSIIDYLFNNGTREFKPMVKKYVSNFETANEIKVNI